MRKFIITILSIGCIIYGLSWGLDLYISYRLQHAQDRKYVGWSDITQTQLDADLVIVGPSRAWVQFNPLILDSILHINAYNMGIDGSHLNRQITKYNVFNQYQEHKPQTVIINIDCWSLGWTEGYEREQFFPYMWNPYIRKQLKNVEPFTFAELYLPLYRYTTYKGIASILQEASTVEEPLCKGYRSIDKPWNGEVFNQIDSIVFEADERTLDMFHTFLQERKNEGNQVVFCYAPIYSGVTEKITNLQEMYDTYQAIAAQYDIPILDYTDSYLCADTAYFYNASHLNKRGADIFSVLLANDIDSIGIAR